MYFLGQQTIVEKEHVASAKTDDDKPKAGVETSTDTAVEQTSETDTTKEGSNNKDGAIQEETTGNIENEGDTGQANGPENSGHLENIDDNLNVDVRGQEKPDEVLPDIVENVDVEMTDTENGDEQKKKEDMDMSGIVQGNSNADLSEQFKDIHIDKSQPGHITDNSKTTKSAETVHKVNQTKDDESKDEDGDDDTIELQSNGNGQVKRSRNQKENEKKRKQDQDNTERQNDQEVENDSEKEQSQDSFNHADSVEQTIETTNQKDEDITENQTDQGVNEDSKNAQSQDSSTSADSTHTDSTGKNEQTIETESAEPTDTTGSQSNLEGKGDSSNEQKQDSFMHNDTDREPEVSREQTMDIDKQGLHSSTSADSILTDSTGKNEQTIETDKTEPTDTTGSQSNQEGKGDSTNVQKQDSFTHNDTKREPEVSREKVEQTMDTDEPKDFDQEPNTDGENESQNKNSNKTNVDSQEMVFGPGKHTKSETSGNTEIKAPLGNKLFTLSDDTTERTSGEQKEGNDKIDDSKKSSASNVNATNQNEDTGNEGTDIDKATERQTRSMTRAKEQTKTNKQKVYVYRKNFKWL